MRKLSPGWRRLINLTAVSVIIVFLPLAIWQMFLAPRGASAAWWNESWLYRKAINITNHTSEEKNVYINLSNTQVKLGTYTGNGTSQSVNVGFQPNFVLIKGDIAQPGVFTTDTMGTNNSKPLTGNTATGANMVTSLDANGFSVGSDAQVNSSGVTYYYLAIRDANGTNFKTFSYVGTGVAHDETICGFTPGLVIIGNSQATAAVFRSSHSGNDSNLFNGTVATNRITGFVTNGFSIGASSVVNSSGVTYYGICARSAAGFMATKQYTGNGTDNTSITGIGFQPDFSVTKRLDTSAVAGMRFKDNSGDSAPTANDVNAANRIQAFEADGFQVGTDDCCNTAAVQYNSFSFKESSAGGGNASIDTSDSTKFQPDCGDLRFTDAAGNLLPYYIVSGCGTSNTVVHVFFDKFPQGAQTIYYYYGNPTAENGFSNSDFATEATGYTIGSLGAEENGPGPLLYFKFDNAYGNVASSSGVLKKEAGLYNSPKWITEDLCVDQKCLFFDGTNDFAQVDNPSLPANDFTYSAWIYPNSNNDETILMASNGTGGDELRVHINNSNQLELYTAGVLRVTSSTKIPINSWTHIAIASASGTQKIYINGRQEANSGSATTKMVFGNCQLLIGADADSGCNGGLGNYFHGKIDEVKIYNYARSAEQIKADMQGASSFLGRKNYKTLSEGLVGYWKLDETSANTCSGGVNDSCDSSGNGNDLAWAVASPTASSAAKFAAGLDFERGSSQYASVADTTTLSITGDLTIAAWIKPESVSAGIYNIAGKWDGSNESYRLIQNGDEIRLELDSSGNYIETLATNLVADRWYHVIGTYSAKDQTARIYINGELASTAQIGTIPSSIGDDTGAFALGAEDTSTTPANFYDGVIDEVRVYKRFFGQQEASQLYNFSPVPLGYWRFDEKTGRVAVDSSGNGKNGLMMNTTARVRGKLDGALEFDGSKTSSNATYVDLGDDADFELNQFSISAWIYRTNSCNVFSTCAIFSKGTSGFIGYSLDLNNVDCSNFQVRFVLKDSEFFCGNTPIQANRWYHVAVTIDTSDIKIYVNGVLDKVATRTQTLTFGSEKAIIGNRNANLDLGFSGKIDDVKFYNYPRSAKEIVEDMNFEHPSPGSPITSALGFWKFDDGYGNVASNSGSLQRLANGQMLNFANPPSATSGWSQDGKFGKALNFDGVDDVVYAGSDGALDNLSAFSVSAWINPRTAGEGSQGIILDKAQNNTPTNGWRLNLTSNKQIQFTVDYSTTDLNRVTVADTVKLFSWQHILVSWDGTSAGANVHIYINGKEAKYITTTDAVGTRNSDDAEDLKIGNDKTRSNTFDGWLDEVKIYNFAMTPDQAKLEYNLGKAQVFGSFGMDSSGVASNSANAVYCVPGDTSQTCAPVGEWRFEERQGLIANDTSGNNNNGILSNGPQWSRGKFGSALSFDGIDDVVTVPNALAIDLNTQGAHTFSVWVYAQSSGEAGVGQIYQKGANTYLRVSSQTGSMLAVEASLDLVTTDATVNIPSAIVANTWNNIVVTYTDDNDDEIEVYINGVLRGVSTNGAGAPAAESNDLLIGGASTANFHGLIDEFRYYNYALSPSQIAWQYNRGKPLIYYKFDECQGTTLNNSTGTASATLFIGGAGSEDTVGTCVTSSTAWGNGASGKFNYSVDLDGTDDAIYALSPGLPTNDFTVSAWVKLDTATDETILMASNGTGGDELRVHVNSNGRVELYTAGLLRVTSAQTVGTNTWTNITVASASGTQKIYINGKRDINTGSAVTQMNFAGCSLWIGADVDAGCGGSLGHYLDGQIDEVQIFNYGLTDVQVRNLYNQNSAVRFGPSQGVP